MSFLMGALGFALPEALVDAADELLDDEVLSSLVSPQAVANTDSASTAADAAESRLARERVMRSPPVAWTYRPAHARATAGVRGSCASVPPGHGRRGWGPAPSRSA